MQTINFLYKVKKLKNNKEELKTIVEVFDCLQARVVRRVFENVPDDVEIKYWLQTCKDFQYKHFQVYFVNKEAVLF